MKSIFIFTQSTVEQGRCCQVSTWPLSAGGFMHGITGDIPVHKYCFVIAAIAGVWLLQTCIHYVEVQCMTHTSHIHTRHIPHTHHIYAHDTHKHTHTHTHTHTTHTHTHTHTHTQTHTLTHTILTHTSSYHLARHNYSTERVTLEWNTSYMRKRSRVGTGQHGGVSHVCMHVCVCVAELQNGLPNSPEAKLDGGDGQGNTHVSPTSWHGLGCLLGRHSIAHHASYIVQPKNPLPSPTPPHTHRWHITDYNTSDVEHMSHLWLRAHVPQQRNVHTSFSSGVTSFVLDSTMVNEETLS